jgi:cytochrome b6-f complex iron-sulfur subunit
VVFDYLEAPAVLILLEDGTPQSFYLACTHFGCIVKWRQEEKDFYCPCHAGIFAPDGTVLAGPPPKPLVELNVLTEGDDLFVEGTVS